MLMTRKTTQRTGCSLSDEDVFGELSGRVHAECVAIFGREQARRDGVTVKGRAQLLSTVAAVHQKTAKRQPSVLASCWQSLQTGAGTRRTHTRTGNTAKTRMERAKTIPKAQAKSASFRTRAMFSLTARMGQASSDQADPVFQISENILAICFQMPDYHSREFSPKNSLLAASRSSVVARILLPRTLPKSTFSHSESFDRTLHTSLRLLRRY